jgi:hypothetical protein
MTVIARPLICFSCSLLLAVGGCSRTGDGSVVIPKQIDARRIWDKGPSPTQTPPVESGANVFPVVAQPRQIARRRTATTPSTAANPQTTAPGKPLSCGAAQDAGERVRVVCE